MSLEKTETILKNFIIEKTVDLSLNDCDWDKNQLIVKSRINDSNVFLPIEWYNYNIDKMDDIERDLVYYDKKISSIKDLELNPDEYTISYSYNNDVECGEHVQFGIETDGEDTEDIYIPFSGAVAIYRALINYPDKYMIGHYDDRLILILKNVLVINTVSISKKDIIEDLKEFIHDHLLITNNKDEEKEKTENANIMKRKIIKNIVTKTMYDNFIIERIYDESGTIILDTRLFIINKNVKELLCDKISNGINELDDIIDILDNNVSKFNNNFPDVLSYDFQFTFDNETQLFKSEIEICYAGNITRLDISLDYTNLSTLWYILSPLNKNAVCYIKDTNNRIIPIIVSESKEVIFDGVCIDKGSLKCRVGDAIKYITEKSVWT